MGFLDTSPEKTSELWITLMEFSCIEWCVVVVDLEVTAALLYGCVPADAFEDGLRPVVPEATLHHLERGVSEQHPDFRMRLVELLEVMGHSQSTGR